MSGNFEHSIAFHAARALVFEGRAQPNGYTEELLRTYRLSVGFLRAVVSRRARARRAVGVVG